ncbi:MAG: hypothetical protein GY906_28385 [bacterium]|nr:hypothetical protein [bacterium]
MTILNTPFKIDDLYWREAGSHRQVTVECPMCCGQRYVTVTIGTGEQYTVECEACGAGYLGPQGVITEYDVTPKAEKFIIAEVKEWRDKRWSVADAYGQTAYFDTLYKTEAEALAASEKRAAELVESNMANRRKKKYGKVSSWTVLYHKRQITDFERQIAWHQAKIDAKGAGEK